MCLFFNGSLIHGSQPNTHATLWRRSFICHYMPKSSKQIAEWYFPLHDFHGNVRRVRQGRRRRDRAAMSTTGRRVRRSGTDMPRDKTLPVELVRIAKVGCVVGGAFVVGIPIYAILGARQRSRSGSSATDR